jgi:cob(I)alamin adenosyltransferase
MPEFYTRKGDEGETGILGKGRVPKYDVRLEALGTVDELNSALGMARSAARDVETAGMLLHVQRDLYALMAELAASGETGERFQMINSLHVQWLEDQVDILSARTSMPSGFIVPGDSPSGAILDLARTTARRAERRVLEMLNRKGIKNIEVQQYLNRLSSLLFVMELGEVRFAGQEKPTMAKDEPQR